MVHVPAYDNVCNKWSGFLSWRKRYGQILNGFMAGCRGRPFLARRLSLHGGIAPIRKQR